MGILNNYPDDPASTDNDKLLTVDSSGATRLTALTTLKNYILAAGNVITSMLADNSVTAAKLATNAITIGHAESTAAFLSGSTTPVAVTGLSVTVTIPSGGRRVKVTAYTSKLANDGSGGANKKANLFIFEGTTSGTQLQSAQVDSVGGNQGASQNVFRIYTPSAGSKTYTVATSADAGQAAISGSPTSPASLTVEVV